MIFIFTTILLILIAILLFCFMIFFHEFGHFFTAKLCGIRVNEFALGMGPKLFSFRKGETTYSLRAFPIGGFCAMEGENGDSNDPRAFSNKAVWKRMIVVVAGAAMNILLGLILMFLIAVQQPAFSTTTIAQFSEDALTPQSGLQVNDTIYAIDGYRTFTARDVTFALSVTEDPNDISFVVLRDGAQVKLEHVQMMSSVSDGKIYPKIDFAVYPEEKTVGTVLTHTFSNTLSYTRMVWSSLFRIVTGQFHLSDLSGPVGTASVITQVVTQSAASGFLTGLNNVLLLMVIITINLGVMNLLPLPALDGGRFLFLLIEAIRRKPINRKYEGWIHAAGFAVLIFLMIIISIKDVVQLF